MLILKWLLFVVLLLAVLAVGAGQLGLLQGRAPADLGVHHGRLKPPSATENSVSSQAGLYPNHPQHRAAQIAPLAMHGTGPQTLARLAKLVAATPGAQVVQQTPDYLYARYSSRLMKYTDDVEFWFDPAAGAVQVRSASRLGRKDFGANRQRVQALRAALAAPP